MMKKKKRKNFLLIGLWCFSNMAMVNAYLYSPNITFQARIFNSQGLPVNETVEVVIQILSPNGDCLLYEESQNNINLTDSNGYLQIQIGSNQLSIKRTLSDPNLSMITILGNNQASILPPGHSVCSAGYTPSAHDTRILKVIVKDQFALTLSTLTQKLNAVVYTHGTNYLQGKTPSDFIQVQGDLTQANLESLLSGNFDASSFHRHDSLYLGHQGSNTYNTSTSSIGIGVANSSYDIALNGQMNRTIGVDASFTGSGKNLTLSAGSALSGSSNNAGGNLVLNSGISTGNQSSSILFQTSSGSVSGRYINNPSTKMILTGSGRVGIGTINPQYELHVQGQVGATEYCLGGTCITSWPSGGGAGTVYNIETGSGLVGGPLTITGTIAIDAGTNQGQIVDVKAGNFIEYSIVPPIITSQIAANAITSNHIESYSINNSHLSSSASLDATKISDGSISNAEWAYLDGINPNLGSLQDQIDNLLNLTGGEINGPLILSQNSGSGTLYLQDNDGVANVIGLKAYSTMSADATLTLPSNLGTNGYVLKTDGSGHLYWEVNSFTGNAGGSFIGFYPNPTLATGSVSTSEILDGSIQTQDIASQQITFNKLQALAPGAMIIGSLTNEPTARNISGDVTLSSTGVLVFNNDSITTDHLINGTLTNSDFSSTAMIDMSRISSGILTLNQTNSSTDSGTIRFLDGLENKSVSLSAATSLNSDVNFTLPTSTPSTNGQVLSSDTSGQLSWVTAVTGTSSAGGDFNGNYPELTLIDNAITSSKILNETITDDDVSSTAAINATKIATGIINNTEWETLDGAISNIQNQVNDKVNRQGDTVTGPLVVRNPSGSGRIAFKDFDVSTHYFTLQAPANLLNDYTLTFPPSLGTNDQIMATDGNGNLSWVTKSVTGPFGGSFSGNFPNPEISTGMVTSLEILDGSISTDDIADGSIGWNKLNNLPTSHIIIGSSTNQATHHLISHDATLTSTGNFTIVSSAITSQKILDGTITDTDISSTASINASKIGSGILSLKQTNSLSDFGSIRFYDGMENFYVSFNSPGSVLSNYTLTWPTSTPSNTGQVLSSDASGNLSWVTVATGNPAAGGDFTGTYPNPIIANNTINSHKILDGTIVDADISSTASINASKIASGLIDNTELSYLDGITSTIQVQIDQKVSRFGDTMTGPLNLLQGADSGALLLADFDGSTHYYTLKAPLSLVADYSLYLPADTGSIDQVLSTDGDGVLSWIAKSTSGSAGGDLTGTYPNPQLSTGSISSNEIQNNTILAEDISDGSITLAKLINLSPGQIIIGSGANQPAANPISGDATLTSTGVLTISDNVISSNKIINGSISNIDINASAQIKASKLGVGVLSLSSTSSATDTGSIRFYNGLETLYWELQSPQVLSSNLSFTLPTSTPSISGDVLVSDTSGNFSWVNMVSGTASAGGDLTGNYPNPTVAANRVDSAKIYDDTIINADINNAANITVSKFSSGIVNNTEWSYLNNVTSNIQTQLDNLLNLSGGTLTGALTLGGSPGQINFYDNDGVSHFMGLRAPTSITSNFTLTLPSSVGSSDQVLITDGNGVLSWTNKSSSGAAGGDLSGNYLNPSIATGAVNSSKISNLTILNEDFGDDTITLAKLENLTAANIIVGNASNRGTATVLSGDATLSSLGALTIANGAVRTAHITDDSIVDVDISTSAAINASKFGSGILTLNQTNSTSDTGTLRLYDGDESHYVALTAPITIASNATFTFPNGAPVSNNQGISSTTLGALSWFSPVSTAGGDLAGTYPNPTLGSNIVGSSKIANDSIMNIDVASTAAITATKLGVGTVDNTEFSYIEGLTSLFTTQISDKAEDYTEVFLSGSLTLTQAASSGEFRLKDADTNYVTIKADNNMAANYTLNWPSPAGSTNQILKTNGSGVLSWDSYSNIGVPTTSTITAGAGLTGGGDLSANRTLDLNPDTTSLEISADILRAKALGVTSSKLVSGAIDLSKLGTHGLWVNDNTVGTVDNNDHFHLNSGTVTFPSAATVGAGFTVGLKNIIYSSNNSNSILDPSGAETIDGATTVELSAGGGFQRIVSNGTNWITIGSRKAHKWTVNCPDSYIMVPADSYLKTNPFCVMRYEAKDVAGVATSAAAGSPWTGSASTNFTRCSSIGAGYALISNPERMAISRNIEKVAANWSGGVVGSGYIPRGHSDNNPANTLSVTNIYDPYDGTGNNASEAVGSGWEQRRTLTLTNGEIIWDFTGNVWESTDWNASDGVFTNAPTDGPTGWTDISSVSGSFRHNNIRPAGNYTGASNYMGYQISAASGGGAVRGGSFINAGNSGLYAIATNYDSSYTSTNFGFRCVYRPLESTNLKIFRTNATRNGNFSGGVAAMDDFCNTDASKPAGGSTYKALVYHSTQRIPNGNGWPLKPNRSYIRGSDSAVIGTTNATAVFAFSLTNAFHTSGAETWTGLTTAWGGTDNCNNWANGTTSLPYGEVGLSGSTTSGSISSYAQFCDRTIFLYCVEQ